MTEGAEETTEVRETGEEIPEGFSLVAGGAFHALLGRMGLLEPDGLPGRPAAMGLALLAFSIPGVMASLQTLLDEQYSGWNYFSDATVYTRYLVAIFVMISAEQLADSRIVLMTRYFRDARLLKKRDEARFISLVIRADRQASSHRAEWLILFIAFAWSLATTFLVTTVSAESWEEGLLAGGDAGLSWAGGASAFTSNTLFIFLVSRWFWRFYIWADMLRRISTLDLQIMPLHPDRCGGLGFLAIFPGIFSGC